MATPVETGDVDVSRSERLATVMLPRRLGTFDMVSQWCW